MSVIIGSILLYFAYFLGLLLVLNLSALLYDFVEDLFFDSKK